MVEPVPSPQITIRFDEEPYCVPPGRTILAALEAAGIRLVRGIGCLGGVCGACLVLYRVNDRQEIKAGLMCQELVQDGMEILPVPYFPQRKVRHDLELPPGESPAYRVLTLYPEVNRCIMCGECTRICPVGIDVMGYVGMIKRGDLRGASRESFICIQCQACVLRCPAQIPQPNAALAARRFYGRRQMPQAEHLTRTLERIQEVAMERQFRKLRRMRLEELQAVYQRREREPEDAPPGTWLPEDRSLLV